MKKPTRASPEFDARCYELRYDEQLSLAEICERVQAAMSTVRKAVRRHAATLSDEPVEREMFGSHQRHLEETAMAARALDRGEDTVAVFARTSFANKESMLMNVRRYRKRVGRPAAPKTRGTALVHKAKRAAQVSLNVRAMRAAKWSLGDAIDWRATENGIVLSRRDEPVERPKKSSPGVVTVVAAMPSKPRLLRVTISVTRLGWKPGLTVRWEWDAANKTILVRPTNETIPTLPAKKKRERKQKRPTKRRTRSQA